MNDAVLTHYGVKGMKWGVRRSEKQLAKAARRRGRSRESSSATPASSMSDDELRAVINRMNMERQYNAMTSISVNNGRKEVNQMLKQAGKNVAMQQLTRGGNALVGIAVKEAMKKASGG